MIQSVGSLWTSDRPVTETSDGTQHSQDKDIHIPSGTRTSNPSKRSAADPRLTPLCHWDDDDDHDDDHHHHVACFFIFLRVAGIALYETELNYRFVLLWQSVMYLTS
jgi:hypothetical protein